MKLMKSVLLFSCLFLFFSCENKKNEQETNTNKLSERTFVEKDTSWWEGNVNFSTRRYSDVGYRTHAWEYDSVCVGENTVVLIRKAFEAGSTWEFGSVINKNRQIKVIPHSDQDLSIAGIREQFKSGDTVDVETYFNDTNRVWFAVRTNDSKIVRSKFYPKYSIVEVNKDILQAMVYTPSHEAMRKYKILHPWKI